VADYCPARLNPLQIMSVNAGITQNGYTFHTKLPSSTNPSRVKLMG
jgi:hypothetical protein